jgi:DNA-binding LacI/PurR family transcriptional regulator
MQKPGGTLRTIGRALNLSDGTVSRALSGRGDIAQETRDRVAELAAELNYVPRRRVVVKPGARLGRIAVCLGNRCVGPDGRLDPTYVGLNILSQLERVASEAQVGVMVAFVDALGGGSQVDRLPMFQPGEAQGIVLVYPFPEAIVRRLAARTPVVSIEHVYPSVSLDTIGPAHAMDAMSAVEHLYKLGHRRIAYVGDEEAAGHRLTMGLRHAGYVSGLARCDLPYRPEDVTNVLGPPVAKPQLAAHVAGLVRDGVTAVITSIDRHGYLLWDRLPAQGVRVPDDVSVVGIGGVYRAHGLPQLTTWRCQYDRLASAALDALRSRAAGSPPTDLYMEIASTFVQGGSSGPPNRQR